MADSSDVTNICAPPDISAPSGLSFFINNVSTCLENLHFALLNVLSIVNNSSDIAELIMDRNFDMLALTETWHCSTGDLSLVKAAQ